MHEGKVAHVLQGEVARQGGAGHPLRDVEQNNDKAGAEHTRGSLGEKSVWKPFTAVGKKFNSAVSERDGLAGHPVAW
jgi:hypothetical protein